ncbi:hypothetical protein BDQ17DRAFT_1429264 [Cyathus striatus]|nr:hypothetical protein BDQ17DRAFT_1429264 [Cyathus striatus]
MLPTHPEFDPTPPSYAQPQPQTAMCGGLLPQAQVHDPAVGAWVPVLPDQPPRYQDIVPNPPPLPHGPPARQLRKIEVIIDVLHINVSIPCATEDSDAVVVRSTLCLETDLPFEDFFDRICAQMDLRPDNALIGYKFKGDCVSDAPHRLSTAEEYQAMIDIAIGKIRHAWHHEVVLDIHNLWENRNRRRTNMQPAKHKADEADSESDTTLSFAPQLQELKEQLACQLHHGRFCYVNPVMDDHIQLDLYVLSLWAKKILLGEALFHNPPAVKDFDHLPRKRQQVSSSISSNTSQIHIHLGDSILMAQRGQTRSNQPIDLTGNSDSKEDNTTVFPLISDVLCDLHEDFPEHNFLQYEASLLRHGFKYVDDDIKHIHYRYLIDIIKMEAHAVNIFLSQAYILI